VRCHAQVLLDWVQIGALLMQLDIIYLAPAWLPAALSGMLWTPQSSSAWVGWDCMQSKHSQISPEVTKAIFKTTLPGKNDSVELEALLISWSCM
jgi:hypothetical protein